MGNPTVSVIMPVYNGEQYLRIAIESVLNQTLQDFEFIIVDDGSSDSTPAIVRDYADRVRYVRQDNTGVSGAFNHGLRLASGRYVSWLSHDDVYLPEKLEKQVAVLDGFGSEAVCYTDGEMIDSRGELMMELKMPEHDRGTALRYVLTGGPICMCNYSVMYHRSCINEVGFYSEHWRMSQDLEMLMRFARRYPLLRVPEVLMQVRDHGDRGTSSMKAQREIVRLLGQALENTPLTELFPETIKRGEAYQWLGDAVAQQSYPVYRLAYAQYRRALREDPSRGASLLGRTAWLATRDGLEIVLRVMRSVPLLDSGWRHIRWRIPPGIRRVITREPAKIDHV